MNDWNSNQYMKFANERTQPSIDLIKRIKITPKSILDIGCGPGNSTNQLYQFFSDANILGIDSSDNMLDKARSTYPGFKFEKCFVPDDLNKLESFDLIFSNACLHWIPNHKILLPKIMDKLNDGGVFAVQMPMVQNALFYKALNEVVSTSKWNKLNVVQNFYNLSPNETYNILSGVSKSVEMWETTYYHIVSSYDDIINWYKGSGLRPYLEKLADKEKEIFISDIIIKLKEYFPINSDNTILLKMPRLFFIASK
ncbi:MAG: methyltransferase domain-containing protein [Anaeroplasmataceae bacterium]